jgi:hypothetical protein
MVLQTVKQYAFTTTWLATMVVLALLAAVLE